MREDDPLLVGHAGIPSSRLRTQRLDRLLTLYRDGRQQGSFETGIEFGLRGILANPKFVLRVEPAFAEAPAGNAPPDRARYRIDDYELASRLSFFLWSSIPDDELLAVAKSGRLHDAIGPRDAGAAHARGPPGAGARQQLRGSMAPAAKSSEHGTGQGGISGLRRQPPAAPSSGKPSCSSTASSVRTAASSIC